MSRKEQRLPLTDVLWILGLLMASGSTFVVGVWVGSGFANQSGAAVTWPTALGWFELAAAFMSAGAVAGAGWIAYRSFQSQQSALEHQEWILLLERRLQFREDVRAQIAADQFKQPGHEEAGLRMAELKRAAPYLFGPDVAKVVARVFNVCSTLEAMRTGGRITEEEGGPEGAQDLYEEATELHKSLFPLRHELEDVFRPYLRRRYNP